MQTAIPSSSDRRSYIMSIAIIGILFFIFGFVTWLNGTLIPFLKISCELSNLQAYFVTFAFYISYLIMAPPSSWVLHKIGFKNGMAAGLAVMALGSLIFIPAAMTRTFGLFLTGLFVQGSGLALLQTASNPYITIIGPRESAAKRIAIMGICNKLAGTISPIILGALILQGANELMENVQHLTGIEKTVVLDNLAMRVVLPYIVMAAVLLLLTFMIRFAHLPEIDTDKEEITDSNQKTKKTSWYQFPHLILGFITLFLYVGVEVMAGDTIALYGKSLGISLDQSRYFTSLTLISMVIGYIIGIITIPRIIKQDKALAVSAVLGVIFTLAALFTSGFTSVLFIALLGLANAMMWPSIWPLAIADLGKFTKAGSALLVMGIAGGAIIPLIYGSLVDIIGNQQAYWIMVPFYFFILYYALSGHKIRK
ncbi:MAG: sugar MFS transporter [Lentimicrobiaceae bacterium]|nr:sugar MFS transporter [Lentimicrobiaceae bacterium]MCB9024308.1 sugar MFS transporter [Lentimicrobiaceae bacterium]MCO5264727.1 sugar MFS transporter [Lentimicrobium sp.]